MADVATGDVIQAADHNSIVDFLTGQSGTGQRQKTVLNTEGVYYVQPSSDPTAGTIAILIANSAGTTIGGITFDGKYVASASLTNAAPPHTFQGDTDTGMYRVSANVLGFATGGSERARMSSSGLSLDGGTYFTTFKELTRQTQTGGTVTVDFSSGLTVELTSNANLAITLSNGISGQWHAIIIKYGGTHTVTFSTTVNWPAATTPTWTSTNGKSDIVFIHYDGTNWRGDASLNFAV